MIPEAELDALLEGRHSDPFAVLGPHPDDAGSIWLRALLPGARQVEAIDVVRAAVRTVEMCLDAPAGETHTDTVSPRAFATQRWSRAVCGRVTPHS